MSDSANNPSGRKLSEDDLRQFDAQGAFLSPSTRDFLKRTGIASGMRVLDASGDAGDVAFLVAEMVGSSGEVVGINRAEALVSIAAARAEVKGIAHVRFMQRDLDQVADLAVERPFDAVVSRLGIVHHPRPAEVIRKLIRLVRAGGVVGFQEVDLDARYWSTQKLQTMDQFYNYVDQLAKENGIPKNLAPAFVEAFNGEGIVERRIIRSGAIECSSDSGTYSWIANFARAITASMGNPGTHLPDFGQPFETRLQHEVESKNAAFTPFHFIGAAGRLPPAASADAPKS